MSENKDTEWWRSAIIYQIYPRSFLDTNNDGIGDLPGITEKIPYIKDLGIDGIWISPFFKSPMKDFGYDVSDYRDVDPIFGTLDDFKTLLSVAHDHNLKIIIDLVLSHTSDQHPWFEQSRKDKTNPKADWYVWADGKTDKNGKTIPPNNWVSCFGGPAWTYDKTRNQYYMHNFLTEQPDLNFHNPEVQDAALDLCRFWLDMGVDGFRLDTVNFYFHDQELRDNPPRTEGTEFALQLEKDTPYSQQQHIFDKSRPENLDFLTRLREVMNEYPETFTVGEIGDDHPYKLACEYTIGNDRLHTTYNTHMMTGAIKKLTAQIIQTPVETVFNWSKSDNKPEKNAVPWPGWAFSNHDVVRAASRWYKEFDQSPQFSKLLIALLGCLPGTLFIYQGEELGLPEAKIPFEKLQDPWAKETWPEWQGRDGCRTPMPWNNTNNNTGFSSAAPWLPIPETHDSRAANLQEEDQNSVLNFTKKFFTWRKNQETLLKGKTEFITTNDSDILEIHRRHNNINTICIFNLSENIKQYSGKEYHGHEFSISGFLE